MAIDQNTQPAPTGKADKAERLIAESLCTTNLLLAKLTQLQQFPDKAMLGEEIQLLKGVTNYISDADCGLDAVLEDVAG